MPDPRMDGGWEGGGLGVARDGRIKYDDNTWQTGDRIRANYFRAQVVEYLPKNT